MRLFGTRKKKNTPQSLVKNLGQSYGSTSERRIPLNDKETLSVVSDEKEFLIDLFQLYLFRITLDKTWISTKKIEDHIDENGELLEATEKHLQKHSAKEIKRETADLEGITKHYKDPQNKKVYQGLKEDNYIREIGEALLEKFKTSSITPSRA